MSAPELPTIVAPATPAGRAALSICRIDGPRSIDIAASLARRGEPFEERRATVTDLFDGEELLDEAVVVAYRAPRSFTGNDLVEITLHGSPFLTERFLRAAVRLGARLAEPGEFTERAVLNGKMDLVQAESIADLIASRTQLQARVSLSNLDGELSRAANRIREDLLFMISRLEAALDFADEGYEFITRSEVLSRIGGALAEVQGLERSYDRGRATVRGLTAVILGRPNAGKSTLLNYLCGSDRAIVTPIPGTTRDLLRETVEIGGLPVTLVDTAGLRPTSEVVEGIGIARAREAGRQAELVLYLIDSAGGLTSADEEELALLPDPLVVFTKCDLAKAPEGAVAISVRRGDGVEAFLTLLDRTVRERWAVPEGSASVVNERQRGAVADCADGLTSARSAVERGENEEVVLVDLYRAANALGVLTGAISTAEVLAEIFSKFCIGK